MIVLQHLIPKNRMLMNCLYSFLALILGEENPVNI